MPYHNFHFNMNELLSFLNKYFEVSYKQYFSDYFYLTRIIGPLISKKTPYEHDNMFKKLSSFFLIEKQIGPQFLLLLKKK